MDKEILRYYEEDNEHERLRGDAIEKIRTKELISRFLSKQPMKILDIGGATGIYSFWLAAIGHHVHLLDASPKHIQQAEEISEVSDSPLESIVTGNALTLPYGDAMFDGVLFLGPLYHLTCRADRIKALVEAKRVMKSGAMVFCAVISRYASMIDGFLYNYVDDPDFLKIMNQDLKDGQHRGVPGKDYFTTAFFHLPEELESEITDSGFSVEGLFGVEGISEIIPNLHERMKDDNFRTVLLDTIKTVEQDKSFLGMNAHILGVGRKP